jgi:hypothetical protein
MATIGRHGNRPRQTGPVYKGEGDAVGTPAPVDNQSMTGAEEESTAKDIIKKTLFTVLGIGGEDFFTKLKRKRDDDRSGDSNG